MAKRVDGNQKQITKELRDLGFSVALTHELGKGHPDILVGFYDLLNVIIELKIDEKKKLTKDEAKFHENWKGQISIDCSTLSIIEEMITTVVDISNMWDDMYNVLQEIKEKHERQIYQEIK